MFIIAQLRVDRT